MHQFRKLAPRKRHAGSSPASSAMIKFFKKTEKTPENLKEVLEHLRKLEESNKKVAADLEDFKKLSKKTLQKVGMVRFNPFKEMGGEQSFVIALLDADNNGFVISSLYGQESSRVYAKPIANGKSSYSLSKEEEKAVTKAMGNNHERSN